MLIQALRNKSLARYVAWSVLIAVITPTYSMAASLPDPTDRWLKPAGKATHNLPPNTMQLPIDNALPDSNPNVRVGTVIVSDDGTTMTIQQASDRALIDWSTFNIGEKNTVEFRQPGVDSVALNRIFQQSPSKIFGNLKANGNVWLFNPNGIFFGKGSQVNVRGIIASAMEFNGLDENTFATADLFGAIDQGQPFLSNLNSQISGSEYCAGPSCRIFLVSDPNPLCTGASCNDTAAQNIIRSRQMVRCEGVDCRAWPRIIIEDGASIQSHSGGPLLLAASEVINEGRLTASGGGQVVLAGSKKDVYLALSSPEDTDMRGFLVEVDSGSVHKEGGAVVNAGDITANMGNVTLVAKEVVQGGNIGSMSAVDVNGSIRLIARDGGNIVKDTNLLQPSDRDALYLDDPDTPTEQPESNFVAIGKNAGTVIMQEGSSIRVDIDQSGKVANNSLEQPRSRIHIEGKEVYMGKGAEIVAPGATVTVRARSNPVAVLSEGTQWDDPTSTFIMDDNAVIDVSGTTDTVLESDRNNVEFFVTSNELKDAPQQKGGPLLRETIKVDIRRGTPLFDWTVALDNVEKTAGERNAAGGSIDIKAGAVELRKNATLDVSGGFSTYKSGWVESSRVVSYGVVDIAEADPAAPLFGTLVGDANTIVDPKWGERSSFRPGASTSRYWREQYREGADAGVLQILAGEQLYDPGVRFFAHTTIGPYQRTGVTGPAGGLLAFDAGIATSNVYIHNDLDNFGNNLVNDEIHLLARQLEESGTNKLAIRTDGSVNLGTRQNVVTLNVSTLGRTDLIGGTLSGVVADLNDADMVIDAAGISLYGTLRAASADIAFLQSDINRSSAPGYGVLQLDGRIDTSGQWVNDRFSGGLPDSALQIDGGSVALISQQALQVSEGSFIRTDAGAWLNKNGKLTFGQAGDIDLRNTDLRNNSNVSGAVVDILGGFSAIDAGSGGVLTVEAENFNIGGSANTQFSNQAVVGDGFFHTTDVGGFRFIAGNGNVTVENNADINLSHKVYARPGDGVWSPGVDRSGSRFQSSQEPSADNVQGIFDRTVWSGPNLYLSSPSSLRLEAKRPEIIASDTNKGIVTLLDGSHITGAPESIVSIAGSNRVLLDGTIDIAGGDLRVTNTTADGAQDADTKTYIYIGDNATIDLSAQAISVPGNSLLQSYRLVEGGSVDLTAYIGSVITSQNADVRLRGATAGRNGIFFAGKNAYGRGGRIVSDGKHSVAPTLSMAAGSFSLEAEKGFSLGNVIDFGSADTNGDGETDFVGGDLRLRLNYDQDNRDPSPSALNSTLDILEIALGDTQGLQALSQFSFGDDLPVGFISGSNNAGFVAGKGRGFINQKNLSASHLDTLVLSTRNSFADYEPPKTALSYISASGPVDLRADSRIFLETNWIDVDNASLNLYAPYVQLGIASELRNTVDQALPSAPIDLKAGAGTLAVDAGLIDLVGNIAVTGVSRTSLKASSSVRTRSVVSSDGSTFTANFLDGSFSTFGDLLINTPVLYGSTLSSFDVNLLDGGKITLDPYINAVTGEVQTNSEPVISYGARLGLNGGDIAIASQVRAPYGSLDLNAQNNLTVSESGVLSVAAVDGTRIPLGRTQGGDLYWTYSVKDGFIPLRFNTEPDTGETSLSEKSIQLSGKNVDAQGGSIIDLSGGGEVYATEFVAGLGGTVDILNNISYGERFVLIKGMTSGFAPYDPAQYRGTDIPLGTSIEIMGSDQLDDGTYTVLPASYAFLQDAYLVEPFPVEETVLPGYRSETAYGAEVILGRLGNASGSSQSNWQAFKIEQGFRVGAGGTINDSRAEYRYASMDNFFEASAPGALPSENGRLSIDVIGSVGDQLSLLLASSVRSSGFSRIGSSVDIASNQDIVITNRSTPLPGSLLVSPQLLNATGADSVLLGGKRSWIADEKAWKVNTSASSLSVDGVALGVEELMLTGQGGVVLNNGATISANGSARNAGSAWLPDGDAATLLVSKSRNSQLVSTPGSKNYGAIDTSGGSIDTSGTLGVAYDGSNALTGISLSNGRLQLFSNDIIIGSSGNITVDPNLLQAASRLELEALGLISVTDTINIANIVDATLRTAQIDVLDGASLTMNASQRIRMQALQGTAAVVPLRASSLTLKAPEIDLSSNTAQGGNLAFSSAGVTIEADQRLTTAGDVRLQSAGDLTVKTPLLFARESGRVDIAAGSTLQLTEAGSSTTSYTDTPASGARFHFSGQNIDLDTSILAPAGLIEARSSNGLTVGANALLAVPAVQFNFPDGTVTSPEGILSLIASGDLTVADADAFVFGADGDDSNGGLLELLAGGLLTVGTGTTATAFDHGRDLSMQGDSLGTNALLWLNQRGFDGQVSAVTSGLTGDIILAGGDVLAAQDLSLIAGNADLSLQSGSAITTRGNHDPVTLYAGNNLTVAGGASISVQALNGQGGDLSLQTPRGEAVVDIAADLAIDGDLEIVAAANASATDVQVDASDNIGGEILLYLSEQFNDASLTLSELQSYVGQAVSSATNAVVTQFVTAVKSVRARPLVDISTATALNLPEMLDLSNLRANGEPGRLVLRAGNDINIARGLGDGVGTYVSGFTPDTDILLEGESWDFSLASGALDIVGVARADFTSRTQHDITLAADSYIRTGTGDVRLQATGDLLLGQSLGDKAYISTLGRADYAADPYLGYLPSWGGQTYIDLWVALGDFSGFSKMAGAIDIRTGGSLIGYSDQGLTPASFIQSIAEDGFGFNSPGFLVVDYTGRRIRALALNELEAGIHAVGGGDVAVTSRDRVQRLGFSTPGLAMGSAVDGSYNLIPGGDLLVEAWGDIVNSAFANDGASVSIHALGSIRGFDPALGENLSSYDNAGQQSMVSPGLFLSGSATAIRVVAGSDIELDGIANTTVMPLSVDQEPAPGAFMSNNVNQMTSLFFDGYDTMSLSLTSVAGDVAFTNDVLAVKSILGSDLIDSTHGLAQVLGQEERFRLFPSLVEFNALAGDIELYDSMMLFPSADMNLALRAVNNISLHNPAGMGTTTASIYLPDYLANQLPTSQHYFTNVSRDFTTGSLIDFIFPIKPGQQGSETTLARIRPSALIQRPESLSTRLYAMTGNLGNDNQLAVFSPIKLDVYAGEDIRNTAFAIQHSNPGDISEIRAGNDLRYDIDLNGTKVADDTGRKYINIAGGGDLIVSAGHDIDLGASDGIVATGNIFNPLLPDKGASLHLFAGYGGDRSGFGRLVGDGLSSISDLSGLVGLGLSQTQVSTLTVSGWFERLTLMPDYASDLSAAVGKATGKSYGSLDQALADWYQLNADMQLRVSVFALKEVALANPEVLVNNGEFLFEKPPLGAVGFASPAERRSTFATYWNSVSALIALDKLLSPEREGDLLDHLPVGMDLDGFAKLSIDSQLNTAVATFNALDQRKQTVVAQAVLNDHVKQSSVDVAGGRTGLFGYERGFVALRRFFGGDLDAALIGAALRSRDIKTGTDSVLTPDELTFGEVEGRSLNSFTEVLQFWEQDSGEEFNTAEINSLLSVSSFDQLSDSQRAKFESKYGLNLSLRPEAFKAGNISLVFSSVRSKAPGSNIDFNLPSGEVDVGLSADLIKSLGVKVTGEEIRTNELGVITEFYGDINGYVASGFNVNESRTFSLAGGDINLWATWGDIDAGKGARTAVTTPEARFVVDATSGAVTKVTPPAVSGSGIKTAERRLASSSSLSPRETFYQVAPGVGAAVLGTPLGVVDAGEAGIAAPEVVLPGPVRGADAIKADVSVGLTTTSSVSTTVATSGDGANQASDDVTESISSSASDDAASSTTAFVTIELLDTGISFESGPAVSTDVCAGGDGC